MTDVKLISYIKDGLKKGYSKDELNKLLVENGWNKKEVTEALKFIDKEDKKTVNEKPKPRPKQEESILKKFVRESIEKGVSETEIKNVLTAKGWKPAAIADAFRGIKKPKPVKIKETKVEKPKKEKKKPEKKEGKKFEPVKIVAYLVSLLFLSLILTGTFVVFFYIQGMNDYEVTDTSGNALTKTCLEEDCSDLKDHALTNVKDNLVLSILTSIGIALIALVLHFILPFKTQLLWIYNILYFLFLGLILFFWIRFQSS